MELSNVKSNVLLRVNKFIQHKSNILLEVKSSYKHFQMAVRSYSFDEDFQVRPTPYAWPSSLSLTLHSQRLHLSPVLVLSKLCEASELCQKSLWI